MDRRRTTGVALIVTALVALLASMVVSATNAQAAALSITYTPSVVADGMTISVSGNAGKGNAPDLYVAVCEDTPTASNCDQSLSGLGTPTAHILVVSPNPTTGAWGPVNFYVRQVIKTGHTPAGFDCKAAGTCVIGTTNSANPADHTYNVTKALDFGSTPPPPSPTQTTTSATPTPTQTSASPTPTTTSATPTPTTTSATPTPTQTSASPTPTDPGGLSISYSPSVVADGTTISVRGNAGKPGAPDLYVAVCEGVPSASNCDQSLIGVGGPKAHILQVSPDAKTGAWGPVNFFVRQVIVTGHTPTGFDCKSHGTCVIGSTNSVNPADHTYNVTAPLNFSSAAVPTLPPTVPPSDGALTVSATGLQAGAATTVSGSGFAANTPVTIGMYSSPLKLATTTTDTTGAFSTQVTVPKSAPAGQHTLVAIGATPTGTSRTLTQSISVTAAPSPSSSSSTGGSSGGGNSDGSGDNDGSGGTLAATGASGSSMVPLVSGAALALLLLGLILAIGAGGRHRHA